MSGEFPHFSSKFGVGELLQLEAEHPGYAPVAGFLTRGPFWGFSDVGAHEGHVCFASKRTSLARPLTCAKTRNQPQGQVVRRARRAFFRGMIGCAAGVQC